VQQHPLRTLTLSLRSELDEREEEVRGMCLSLYLAVFLVLLQ